MGERKLSYQDLKHFLDNVLTLEEIDLSGYNFIDPVYWAILTAEKLRRNQLKIKPPEVSSPAYGFFKRMFQEGRTQNTIPIRIIDSRRDIDGFVAQIIDLMDIDNYDWEDLEFFKYIIGELANNALDHGQSEAVVCAQKFPNIDEVEISIVDIGLGFRHTISRRYDVSSAEEAIKLAIQKGVSGAQDYVYGHQRNAGMGLYVISRIVRDAGGEMTIVSDECIYKYPADFLYPGDRVDYLDNEWKGSIVLLRFNLPEFEDKVLSYGFYHYMNMIIGEESEDIF